MGDFDKLSFEVEVKESSFDTTISRLDIILKKLGEIQNKTNASVAPSISVKGVDTSASSKKAQTAILQQKNSLLSLEKAYESYSSATGRWENAQASLQTATTNLRVAEERHNEALKNPLATIKEREKALRSLERAQVALTKAQNNADIAEQNVGNAQRSIEQRENSYGSAELRTQRALLSEIDKFQERISRNEQLQTSTGYQQALEKQVKLLQDKKLLLAQNESKTIGTPKDVELRALQRQNEERRKAVDLEIKRNGALSEGFKKFSESGQLNETDKKVAKDKGEYQAYLDLQKLVEQEERLNSAWAKQIETLRLLNQEKQKKLTYDIISNDSNVRAENVATKIAQLNANTAVSADLAASAEGRLALEEKARVQYGQQLITQMERLRAEQEALNNGKWEEARAIELANKQRKQEIDTRLKSQLGLKEEHQQVQKNTNVWSTYLAKITSVVMIARRLGSFFAAAIQEGASYTENLVLFSTAFGKSTEEQLKWAENLAKSYGLARNEVVKFAGTFRELANSLGIVGETADYVTRTVTNLGYDLSALFNTSVTTAMEKLQSGIFTGQTKPLRSYGIDISQESIDRLIETDDVLKELGVSARDLSQSEKTVARLLITMRSASNSFGTMAKEINNLQSQFRIFQGSLSEFKLAIGNLVQEPLRNAMVYINGFIIALTNIVNAFAPQKEDKTIFESTTEGAENTANAIEDANKKYDELTGKLAGFDKFNVLQQKEDDSSTLAVTNRLNELLSEEAVKYEEEVQKAMDKIKNEAVETSKSIIGWFVKVDEEGNILYENDMPIWTDNAKALGAGLTTLASIMSLKLADSIIGIVKNIFTLKNATALLSATLVAGAIFAFVKMVEAFENGDYWAGILAGTIGITLAGAFLLLHKKSIASAISSVQSFIGKMLIANGILEGQTIKAVLASSTAFLGLGSAIAGAFLIFSNWDNMENWQRFVGVLGVVTTAVLGLAMAFGAFHSAWSMGLATAGIIAGMVAIVASIATIKKDIEEPIYYSTSAHADGGYTNANLIMTHENGKREWVGKAAGSSAIVNDTQMSDIMEAAVAKGVYRAFSNSRTESGSGGTTKNVYNFQVNGRTLLSVMEDEARKQGKRLVKA